MNRPQTSTSRTVLIASLLTVLGAFPRLVGLDRLSFYADEDLSALVASSMASGRGGHLPSGFEYRRARPFTQVMVLSLRAFGGEQEGAFRFPGALFGVLSIPILFLFGRRFVGEEGAFAAALLFALSEWHIGFSRQARMYAPLVFTVILGAWALWSWCRSGRARELLAGLAAGILAAFLHRGGVVLGAALLVWLALPGETAVPALAILGVGLGLSAVGYGISAWTLVPYGRVLGPTLEERAVPVDDLAVSGGMAVSPVLAATAAIGVFLGVWLARRLLRAEARQGSWRVFVLGSLAALTGAMAGLGQIYGLGLAACLLLVTDGRGLRAALARAALPGAAIAVLLVAVAAWGVLDGGLRDGLERAARLPYPHVYTLIQQTPVFFGLFLAACAWAAVAPRISDGIAACVLTSAGLLFGFGVLFNEVPTRYLLPVYPFILLTVGSILAHVVSRALARAGMDERRRHVVVPGALAAIVATGALGGHGIPQAVHLARLEHGEPMNRIAHMFSFRPDHRTAGLYVRAQRRPGDVVIAEDPLVQGWYAGSIDYWFRRPGDMRRFLELRPDGSVRDIYVGSAPLPDPARVDSLALAASGRVWFISSGETRSQAEYYLAPEQRAWLDSLARAREPLSIGEDGVTAVYCLNCPPGTGAPSP